MDLMMMMMMMMMMVMCGHGRLIHFHNRQQQQPQQQLQRRRLLRLVAPVTVEQSDLCVAVVTFHPPASTVSISLHVSSIVFTRVVSCEKFPEIYSYLLRKFL